MSKTILKLNKHNLSHFRLGTCFPGELIPVGLWEISPGDIFRHKAGMFLRFLPMNAPLMQNCEVRIHHFYCPMRILWDGFEDFITRKHLAEGIPFIPMNLLHANADAKRLFDYLGVGMTSPNTLTRLTALIPAMYNKIYNEMYRDADLITPLEEDPLVYQSDLSSLKVRRISWAKDYFTASRPWPQKGADVTLPLGTEAPLVFPENINDTRFPYVDQSQDVLQSGNKGVLTQKSGTASEQDIVSADLLAGMSPGIAQLFAASNGTPPFADLLNASGVTVNVVRRAFELQRLGERLAQFGSRYPEYLASMGIKSSDGRLQRPEYLGGGKVPVSFSEVLQTAEAASTPVGEMRGHGMAPGGTRAYTRFFEENGYVMSLMSVKPQAIYSSITPRHWFHGFDDNANDFYTPELERIGQQEIRNREIWSQTGGLPENGVFGWGDRYDEYRHQPSQVSGQLKVGDVLDYWTWSRGFATQPQLNETFITCDPDSRVFADEVNPPIIYGVNHKVKAKRMLTKKVTGRIF